MSVGSHHGMRKAVGRAGSHGMSDWRWAVALGGHGGSRGVPDRGHEQRSWALSFGHLEQRQTKTQSGDNETSGAGGNCSTRCILLGVSVKTCRRCEKYTHHVAYHSGWS